MVPPAARVGSVARLTRPEWRDTEGMGKTRALQGVRSIR